MTHMGVQPGMLGPRATDHEMRLVTSKVAQGVWPPIGELCRALQRYRIREVHLHSNDEVAIGGQHNWGIGPRIIPDGRADPRVRRHPLDQDVVVDRYLTLEEQRSADPRRLFWHLVCLTAHFPVPAFTLCSCSAGILVEFAEGGMTPIMNLTKQSGSPRPGRWRWAEGKMPPGISAPRTRSYCISSREPRCRLRTSD